MDERALKKFITDTILAVEVGKAEALRPELAGMRIFDEPIFAAAAADDPMFSRLRSDEAVGERHFMPADWTRDARFVLSVFFPFNRRVKDAAAADLSRLPTHEWLHARIEGQNHINAVSSAAVRALKDAGFSAVAPSVDERHSVERRVSNWSERHVAFVCGLGTFGLSKGLITEKGVAGRFSSIVTNMELSPTGRKYTELYAYCTFCGLCARKCPAGAIDIKTGKAHGPCKAFLDETQALFSPRYGCGKCQTGVPCESGVPARAAAR